MKKKNFIQFVVGFLAISAGLSSCKKCQTCTNGGVSEEVCQEDYATKSLYKAYINYLEAYGYKCK